MLMSFVLAAGSLALANGPPASAEGDNMRGGYTQAQIGNSLWTDIPSGTDSLTKGIDINDQTLYQTGDYLNDIKALYVGDTWKESAISKQAGELQTHLGSGAYYWDTSMAVSSEPNSEGGTDEYAYFWYYGADYPRSQPQPGKARAPVSRSEATNRILRPNQNQPSHLPESVASAQGCVFTIFPVKCPCPPRGNL
jgi:hypothetical protein